MKKTLISLRQNLLKASVPVVRADRGGDQDRGGLRCSPSLFDNARANCL